MRRKDREVTDFNEIADILTEADTIRVGMHDEPYPYVVPLSYGFEAADGKITFYYHGALKGLKMDLIERNPSVCVEADIFRSYVETSPTNATTDYVSFIGFGKASRVYGEEALHGLRRLLDHCHISGMGCDERAIAVTAVVKVTIESFSAKRRFAPKSEEL
jgi:nitroimidazol reductase NimA-like FMN-containing flavoprotein (pyridoxamine 5'-phosphate oxidase superfamily)